MRKRDRRIVRGSRGYSIVLRANRGIDHALYVHTRVGDVVGKVFQQILCAVPEMCAVRNHAARYLRFPHAGNFLGNDERAHLCLGPAEPDREATFFGAG